MKLYLAGPMRGIPHFNFPAFDDAAVRLRVKGHDVFSPAEHDRSVHGDDFGDAAVDGSEADAEASHGFNLRDALGADLAYITKEADGVAVLPGWENSKGARAEVATALALGLFVAPADKFGRRGEGVATADLIDALPGLPVTLEWSPLDREDIADLFGVPRDLVTGETRTVSSTGGEKGVKLARFDLIPAGPLCQVAEHYGKGAQKYAAHNWRRGYEWSKSFGALQRHAWQWWHGEDIDADTGSHHMAAVAFHALALLQFATDHPAFDDRPDVAA